MDEVATHPLLRPFWRRESARLAENHSQTLDDIELVVRLDPPDAIRLLERTISYYDSSVTRERRFVGRFTVHDLAADRVVLLLSGADESGRAVEMALVVTDADIVYGAAEWARRLR